MAGFLKRLFGGGGEAAADAADSAPDAEHKGVEIRATPIKEPDGQWRIAGTLTKTIDGAPATRRFMRADLLASREMAASTAIDKARLIIDQNGDELWRGDLDRPT